MSTSHRILIVEDEVALLKLMKQQLEISGYLCETTEDVETAKEILKKHPISLILTDIHFPGETGLDLIKYTKDEYPDTAFVAISGAKNSTIIDKVMEMGAYGYLIKPVDRTQLIINIDAALRRYDLEQDSKKRNCILQNSIEKHTAELQQTVDNLKTTNKKLNDQIFFTNSLMDAIPIPISYRDRNGRYQGCNSAFSKFMGQPIDKIIGKTLKDIAPHYHGKNIIPESETSRLRLLEKGFDSYEIRVPDPDGTLRDLISTKATYTNASGEVIGIIGALLDITDQKKIEEDLRSSREKNKQILENINIGVALISPNMHILEMNKKYKEMFPNFDVGKNSPCFKIFHGSSADKPCDGCPVTKTFQEGKVFEFVKEVIKGEKHRYLRIISSPIHDTKANIASVIELVEDITERYNLERELQQAQKLESIGQLAAGIAHEINTPTQYVGDNTRFLKDAFKSIYDLFIPIKSLLATIKQDGQYESQIQEIDTVFEKCDIDYLAEEIPGAIEQTMEGVARVSKIVRAMKEFSHPGTDEKTLININHALDSTITVASNEWKYVSDIEIDFDDSLPPVPCLPGELNQVLLNLIINAAHAIADNIDDDEGEKGKITISTQQQGQTVEIRISDTGTGIPEEIQHRIFDPFFTTKEVGVGTGQGLSIARSVIMEKHGGKLSFDTEPGEGTTFIIELPLKL